jgi:hypothetical protein
MLQSDTRFLMSACQLFYPVLNGEKSLINYIFLLSGERLVNFSSHRDEKEDICDDYTFGVN